ncbi:MAG TPA: MFS transporter [Novosphingobium sp.]|nr:MFS transporter [Novosphingobium sp.]
MSYGAELIRHRRVLAAAMLGMGFGLLLNNYVAGLFGPELIAEFGWSRSDFALVSVVPIVMMVIVPIVGRLADLFGVRRVAVVGVLGIPASFLAMSRMDGSLVQFLLLTGMLMTFGTLTSSTIYTRLVAERFDRARGIAFAIVLTGPPLIGAITAPLLADLIAAESTAVALAALRCHPRRSAAFAARGAQAGIVHRRFPPHRAPPGVLADRGRHVPVQPAPGARLLADQADGPRQRGD